MVLGSVFTRVTPDFSTEISIGRNEEENFIIVKVDGLSNSREEGLWSGITGF